MLGTPCKNSHASALAQTTCRALQQLHAGCLISFLQGRSVTVLPCSGSKDWQICSSTPLLGMRTAGAVLYVCRISKLLRHLHRDPARAAVISAAPPGGPWGAASVLPLPAPPPWPPRSAVQKHRVSQARHSSVCRLYRDSNVSTIALSMRLLYVQTNKVQRHMLCCAYGKEDARRAQEMCRFLSDS